MFARTTHVLIAALLAAGLSAGAVAATSSAATQAASTAPECVTVTVTAHQLDGTVHRTRLEFCGSGPGGDSALHDWAAGHSYVLDGATAIGNGCGGTKDPCVIFPGS